MTSQSLLLTISQTQQFAVSISSASPQELEIITPFVSGAAVQEANIDARIEALMGDPDHDFLLDFEVAFNL